jgi:hypothetical protein
LPHYNQVLTGLLSNDDSYTVDWDARRGERPPRPTDPSRNQWLQDPVWDAITTCWSNEPEERCELDVVYDVFLTLSPQNAQNTKSDKPGDLNVQNSKNLAIAEMPQTSE